MCSANEYQYHTIYTPELVDLNLPLAGLGRRVVAMLIDQVILNLFLLTIWVVGFFILALIGGSLHSQIFNVIVSIVTIFAFLATLASGLIYFWAFHTFNNGRTLGKQFLNIQVVTDRGGTASGTTHFIRALAGIVDLLLLYGSISALMILMNKNEKRIADYAAGTVVIVLDK